jgi:hypothetical protein
MPSGSASREAGAASFWRGGLACQQPTDRTPETGELSLLEAPASFDLLGHRVVSEVFPPSGGMAASDCGELGQTPSLPISR